MRSFNRFAKRRRSREQQHEYRGSERFSRDPYENPRRSRRRSRHHEPYDEYEYQYEEDRPDPDYESDHNDDYGYAERHGGVRRLDDDSIRYDVRDQNRHRGNPKQYDQRHYDDRHFYERRRPGRREDVASDTLRNLWHERTERDTWGRGEQYQTRRKNHHANRPAGRRRLRRQFVW